MRDHPRRLWPNAYVDVRGLHLTYLQSLDADQTTFDTSKGQVVLAADSAHCDQEDHLISLASGLVNFLRIARIVDFLPSSYFPHPEFKSNQWTIGFIDKEEEAQFKLDKAKGKS